MLSMVDILPGPEPLISDVRQTESSPLESYEPSAGGAVYLRGLSRWQAEDQREDLADLYVESADTEPGEEYRSRESFLRRLADDVRSARVRHGDRGSHGSG
ncbi:hypothetical protein GCM10020000_82010 [Streptomyces olivoverticillatus]